MDLEYLRDVLDVLLRFLHVVAGIAWIGASFYFIRLDLGLRAPESREDERRGVAGEYWGVHGGGFYHSQKYRVAPPRLPEHLHWFKWEAYTTWLSGFALLVVLYYLDAEARLVDRSVASLEPWQAVVLSVAGLAVAWLAYDAMCRLVRSEVVLALGVAALVVLSAWSAGELFAARAAFLQVGAMLGTIMAANVFFTIIPAHWELVRAKRAGREPDPAPGVAAKRRSVHNNYLTLPVVFTMLAGHFPIVFGRDRAWLVLLAVMGLSAYLRHFFNAWHVGRREWAIPAVVGVAVVLLAVGLAPEDDRGAEGPAPSDDAMLAVVEQRCATCHAGASAPAGVRLESVADVRAHAAAVERMAVDTRAMPPGNVTGMTNEERDLLAAWLAAR